jgi:hypothetical protein
MKQFHVRLIELGALVMLALALIGLAAYMVYLDRTGEALGSVIGAVVLIVQAVRNVGQSQAMQSMVDHLAKSTPVKNDESQ